MSHDRRLLETVCERLWVVDDGLAVPFDGGYRAWRAAVADGWTVEAEAARRANRGRPAAVGTARRRRRRRGGIGRPGERRTAVVAGDAGRGGAATAARRAGAPRGAGPKLSKDAYRRQRGRSTRS